MPGDLKRSAELAVSAPTGMSMVAHVVLFVGICFMLPHARFWRVLPWHVLAVGGSRRSAHNAGIRVKRTVFLTYVFSGFCASRMMSWTAASAPATAARFSPTSARSS